MRDYLFEVVCTVPVDCSISPTVSRLLQFAVSNQCGVRTSFCRNYYRGTTTLLVGVGVTIYPGDSFTDKVMEIEEALDRELEIKNRIRREDQSLASDFSNGDEDNLGPREEKE